MAEINSTYTVEKNTTLWSVAKNICKKTDDNVSNADIVKEMKRLAKLNGYDDFNELGDKFKKIGNKIKVDNAVSKETAKKPVQTAHVAQKNGPERDRGGGGSGREPAVCVLARHLPAREPSAMPGKQDNQRLRERA